MSGELRLIAQDDDALEIHRRDGGLLLRYVFKPATPTDESPRPYAHPLNTLGGELLTNFRPHDHRWHHGLSFTVCRVSDHNFWGGVSYRKADGYQWRNDHGTQRHVAWLEKSASRCVHLLEWFTGAGELLLREERALTFTVRSPVSWELGWSTTLTNVSGRSLELGQYHSTDGLIGSHYTGLQFRGARDLLDDHGDVSIGVFGEGGLSEESTVHGTASNWMEWRGQKDTSQRRVTIRFASPAGPLHWFVRRKNPLAAFPFHYDRDVALPDGNTLAIAHVLTFTDT